MSCQQAGLQTTCATVHFSCVPLVGHTHNHCHFVAFLGRAENIDGAAWNLHHSKRTGMLQ